MITRRSGLISAALLGCSALGVGPGLAQNAADKELLAKLKPKDFPTQPIEIVVVYPAGGGMDVNARVLAKFFEKVTGDRAIVANRTGGAGLVGHTYLASQAPKDGYTVGFVANLIIGDAMLRSNGRWAWNDVEPISYINSDGMTFLTNADGPYKDKTLKELLAIAKEKPNTVRAGMVPGSSYEFLLEQLELSSGAKFLKVPFQGMAPAIAALLGNNIDLSVNFLSEMRSFIEAKKVTPLAVTSATRLPFVPDAPTANEVMGVKDYNWVVTRWIGVPKGTPADRKAYLAAGFNAAARDPELQEELRKIGAIPDPSIGTVEQVVKKTEELAEMERQFYIRTGRLKP